MIETAFNLHRPVLKEAFRKFQPRQQGILAAGCEQRAWNGIGKPETCLCHPAGFSRQNQRLFKVAYCVTVCMRRDLRYTGVRSPELEHPQHHGN
jgi:hypothetical protein